VDVTDVKAVNQLIEDNSVDFLRYISWDEVRKASKRRLAKHLS